MMAVSTPLAPPTPAPVALPSRRWIESPSYDLAFFVLSPLLTLPIVFASLYGIRWLPALGFLLAFAHYLSTLTFYFWDENRARHRERWLAFFGGPVIITAVFSLLAVYRVPLVIQFVVFFWNVVHVSRQSCGMLSIYRHRAGVFDPYQKQVANAAILATNVWFCLWNIETHHEVFPILSFVAPGFPRLLWLGAGIVSVALLGRLVVSLRERQRGANPPALPELAILFTGLALFHPFLWLPDSGGATFAMLLPHYVQYLGVVWLLNRRKFTTPGGSASQAWLQRLSTSTPLLVATLLLQTLGLLLTKKVLMSLGRGESFEAFYLLVALLHFYLDGLFWAFRDPHVRRSMGPYLMQGLPVPVASAARAG